VGAGQHHAASIAVKQTLAEFDLQLPHLAAQRGLHHGEKCSGAGEAAELRDVAEVLELFQIHAQTGFAELFSIAITGMFLIP